MPIYITRYYSYDGNKYRIARAYLEKFREFPDVEANDSSELHQFLIVLIECKNAMVL